MDSAPPSGAQAQDGSEEPAPNSGRAVRLEPRGAIVPPSCACCGEPAGASRVETRAADGTTLIVPYCGDCLAHASRGPTRALSVSLASSVLGLSMAAALPLIWVFVPLQVYAVCILLAVLLPFAPLFLRRAAKPPHTSIGRGAWWLANGELYCTHPQFAAELARANAASTVPASARESVRSAWMASGPVLACVFAPFVWWLTHPSVRVVNASETPLMIAADGHYLGRVNSTQSESPSAGIEIRLPIGHRRLVAREPGGRIVADAEVQVQPGAEHLYAPASPAVCFWLETTGYGRTRPADSERVPLSADSRFWVLPLDVDTWFSANPPEGSDSRSTGGVLTALRQAPCDEAPAGVGNR